MIVLSKANYALITTGVLTTPVVHTVTIKGWEVVMRDQRHTHTTRRKAMEKVQINDTIKTYTKILLLTGAECVPRGAEPLDIRKITPFTGVEKFYVRETSRLLLKEVK